MDYSQFTSMQAELSLLLIIVVLFVADLFMSPTKQSKGILNTPLPVILLTLHTLLNLCPVTPAIAFGGMYQSLPIVGVVKTVLNIGTIVVFLMAREWLKRPECTVKQGEFYLLTLSTLLGMYFMLSAGHFLMFFIGLELASVPMTALVAFDKYRHNAAEAGAKFILLALFSSGLLLYGVSLVYGTCGTLYFDDLLPRIIGSPVQVLALVFFIAGMGFKISLVPFHLWTADVYQGAPTVVTGYLSVISKGAAGFVLFTILVKVFAPMIADWQTVLFWIIIASITLANLFAIRQNDLKRFMAFSAISQAGYLVMGVISGDTVGQTALVYYLLVYLVANLAIFAIISVTEQRSGKIAISDYNGFYQTNPKLSFLMMLALFSLAGIPPFAGFFSKFFIFVAAFRAGFEVLVFIALLNTVVSLYYYLLIVKAMYINKCDQPVAAFKSDGYTRLALLICTAGLVGIGLAGCIYEYIYSLCFGL